MTTVSGKTVNVGDYICFKSDVEQGGRIVLMRGISLVLENPNGFEGDYIGGQTRVHVDSRDCWLEGNS